MLTPMMISLTVTTPSAPQSPTQETGFEVAVTVGDSAVGAVAVAVAAVRVSVAVGVVVLGGVLVGDAVLVAVSMEVGVVLWVTDGV